jgi:hypothetical protein
MMKIHIEIWDVLVRRLEPDWKDFLKRKKKNSKSKKSMRKFLEKFLIGYILRV